MTGVRRSLGPLAAGLVVGLYAAAFRHYGIFDLADEGTLLVQAARVAHGQAPYVDFHTGYGTLYFALQGLLVRLGGLDAIRALLVCVQAIGAALLYALTRRTAGRGLTVVAVALQVSFFLPLAPRQGAPFFVPYPAWYGTLGSLAVVLLLWDPLGRGGWPRAACVGVLSGAVFAMKQNTGLLLAGGAAAAFVLAGRAGVVSRAVLALLAIGAVALVVPTGFTAAAWVLAPPVLALAALGVPRGRSPERAARHLVALGAGFMGVAAASYVRSLLALGPERFAREVLLVGAGVAGIYVLPFPWPAALAAAVGAAAFFGASRPGARSVLAVAVLATLVVAGVVGAAGAAGVRVALRRSAEAVALTVVPLTLWGALAIFRRRREDALLAPTAIAVATAPVLYPRPDFAHLMQIAPLLLPLALLLWRTMVERIAVLPRRVAPALVLGLPLLAAALRFAPTVELLARLATGRVEEVAIGPARLVAAADGVAPLRALADVVEQVAGRTAADDRILTFPACGVVPFFAGRLPIGRHDYFYPGRPDRVEMAAVLDELGPLLPDLAVTCTPASAELRNAWRYYPSMVDLLSTRYRVVAEHPPFAVRERRR